MSAHLINKVKKTKVGHPIAKAILFYLADCSTGNGCWPSQKTIAEDMEISEVSVQRYIKILEQKGFITRTYERVGGKISKTFYTLFNGIPRIPSNGICQNPSDRGIPSDRYLEGIPQIPPIDKEVLNDNITTREEGAPREKKKAVGNKKRKTPTFDEIVAQQEADPLYKGIDVRRESLKAAKWITDHPRRKFNKQFFVNWLNNIDPPVDVPPQPAVSDNGFVQVDLPFALMIEVGFMGVPEDDWMNRYQIYRDDWLVTKPDRAIEVADYERSADFAEKSGRKGSGKNGGIVALNGRDGQASPQVPLSR
jgi:biotin operon repressor